MQYYWSLSHTYVTWEAAIAKATTNPLPHTCVEAEQALFAAVETGDLERARALTSGAAREQLAFTGRCYAHAICNGMTEFALLFAQSGFCLNVTSEPAVKDLLASGADRVRGLRGFLETYRYCRAQRTYYLPVVQSAASTEVVRALLAANVGLTAADASELLSLSIRMGNVELARALAEGGAHLPGGVYDTIPDDLRGKSEIAQTHSSSPWVEAVSPQHGLPMLTFLLEHCDPASCPIRRDWFKLYFRDPEFADRLALIVDKAAPALCEDFDALLVTLAPTNHTSALHTLMQWPQAHKANLEAALAAAREARRVDTVTLLLNAQHAQAPALTALDF